MIYRWVEFAVLAVVSSVISYLGDSEVDSGGLWVMFWSLWEEVEEAMEAGR